MKNNIANYEKWAKWIYALLFVFKTEQKHNAKLLKLILKLQDYIHTMKFAIVMPYVKDGNVEIGLENAHIFSEIERIEAQYRADYNRKMMRNHEEEKAFSHNPG